MIHETGKLHKRQIKINYKTQFLINLVLKDKIKKKYKKLLESTNQTHEHNHETEITS
jgi:hypothetical protein